MVPFGGWLMPVQYSGILEEARVVRNFAGMFDVSHMGRLIIKGPGSTAFLDRILSCDVPKLRLSRARYGVICNEVGGIIDDCIVYRMCEEEYLLVPNASNTATVTDWLNRWSPSFSEITITDITEDLSMVALQGPEALSLLDPIVETDLTQLRPFSIIETQLNGVTATIARTGYTGEDGVEFFVSAKDVPDIWTTISEKGAVPCGLGARDVLRLEAGLLLHGNDIDITVNPYEAGLDRFVMPDRENYIAGPALCRISEEGLERRLVGLNVSGRRLIRNGHPIKHAGKVVGNVTSGSYSQTLDRNIGLGYVPVSLATEETTLTVDVRGKAVAVKVAKTPFYTRAR